MAGRSWTMTATVSRNPGDDGVLFTTGTQNSGYAFFVKDDRLCFDYVLHPGVSSQRLGMRVLEEEGVFSLLDGRRTDTSSAS